ncbi:MAG: hypothetical protein ACTS2F_26360 [Thainema sp.]
MRHHQQTRADELDDKIATVLLVLVASFAMGLVPLVYSLSSRTADGQVLVPTEATLWKDAWAEE